ncbi:VOC family protein [Streptomyces lydicus]|uniref:VOC family protein n=1 Tax=Streptomyces lydicus TaxID=47763 RepID=UPI00370324D4
MEMQGIAWNAIVTAEFDKTVAFFKDVFGLPATVEHPGFAQFPQAGGGVLEVFADRNTPPYGFNGGVAFGFRVDDIEAASAELAAAGAELLGEINRLGNGKAYRFFRGPGGHVYGLDEAPRTVHAMR